MPIVGVLQQFLTRRAISCIFRHVSDLWTTCERPVNDLWIVGICLKCPIIKFWKTLLKDLLSWMVHRVWRSRAGWAWLPFWVCPVVVSPASIFKNTFTDSLVAWGHKNAYKSNPIFSANLPTWTITHIHHHKGPGGQASEFSILTIHSNL